MIYIPFYTTYKTPILSPSTGEVIGKRKVRLYALTNKDQTKIIKEVSFCAVQIGKIKKEGKEYKGFVHYSKILYYTRERIFQMARFYENSPNLCDICKEGFIVKQRPGKYQCLNCGI
jgi:hypothetical protein